MALTRTVTIEQKVDRRIEDLVRFVQYLAQQKVVAFPNPLTSEARLVELAGAFWDQQHGED